MPKGEKKKFRIEPIMLLAYFHRYGWIVSMLLIMRITRSKYAMSISLAVYSIWTFIGYKFRWKHIFCSYQNAYHMPMTPEKVCWDTVKKTDAYGVPAIWMVFAIALFLAFR